MTNILAVGIDGFIGANIRYLLSRAIAPTGGVFPFATLVANIIAGIVIGAIIALDETPIALSPKWKLFVNTGLLGGLSTFSTFSLETVNFLAHNGF